MAKSNFDSSIRQQDQLEFTQTKQIAWSLSNILCSQKKIVPNGKVYALLHLGFLKNSSSIHIAPKTTWVFMTGTKTNFGREWS